jgi:hypothetical protein
MLPLNLLKELLPPTPLAFSKTLIEYFFFNLLDIVAPDIPDPITAKSIITTNYYILAPIC